jgi:hypothetical protein
VYCGGTGGAGNCPVPATQNTIDYVGEHGWICKNINEHADANNGSNFHFVAASKITAAGFVTLPVGTIGSGDTGTDYCRLTVS